MIINLDRVARMLNVTIVRDLCTLSWTVTQADGRAVTLTCATAQRLGTEADIAAEIKRMLEEQ